MAILCTKQIIIWPYLLDLFADMTGICFYTRFVYCRSCVVTVTVQGPDFQKILGQT